MGKAVLHFQKNGKPSGGSLGHHIDRIPGMEYSYRHADLSRTKDNISIEVNLLCSLPYNEAIKARIDQGYQHRNKAGELKAIRKDAVYSVNTILSGTHEDLAEIAKDKNRLQEWIDANLDYCIKNFGKENITRFVVHLDEKTPHIHCTFVPITEDGRLSANDYIGTGKKLEDHQTMYADAMAKFGLERGVKSDRKHHTTDDYRRRQSYKLSENREILQDLEELKQTDVFNFKAKKASIFAKLETLILEKDESTQKEIKWLKSQISMLESKNSKLVREYHEIPKSKFLSKDEIKAITESVSLVDYFLNLNERGKVDFEKKAGNEFYFKTGTQRFSVSRKGYFDFKSNTGGQIIKAVMEMEGLSWKQSLDFLQKFAGTNYNHLPFVSEDKDLGEKTYQVTTILTPNNPTLLDYFEQRGLDKSTVKENTKQYHFQAGQKHYFGIGKKNISGGYDLRTNTGKIKLGKSGITVEQKDEGKLIVFEGLTDLLSYIQLLKDRGEKPTESLVSLNSVTNVDKFIYAFEDFKGRISMCLDADDAGEKATQKIKEYFSWAEDVREFYNIHNGRGGANDLNESLQIQKGLIRVNSRGIRF